jgi:hypothetical protein
MSANESLESLGALQGYQGGARPAEAMRPTWTVTYFLLLSRNPHRVGIGLPSAMEHQDGAPKRLQLKTRLLLGWSGALETPRVLRPPYRRGGCCDASGWPMSALPLDKQTLANVVRMSAKCHKRTKVSMAAHPTRQRGSEFRRSLASLRISMDENLSLCYLEWNLLMLFR